MLELGSQLGNISDACRRLGVSRQHYYDIRNAIREEGLEGLLEKSRQSPRLANRVAPEIEAEVLEFTLLYPTAGQVRVSNELKRQKNIVISPTGVRSVWMRHDLKTKDLRLKWL
jgi:transposase